MRTQRGVTLTSLGIYIVLVLIVLAILGTITANLQLNIKEIHKEGTDNYEIDKFNLYFLKEVKKQGNKIDTMSNNEILFTTGNKYTFKEDNTIYLNDNIKVAEYIETCVFSSELLNEKTVITVIIKGKNAETKSLQYVLSDEGYSIAYEDENDYIYNEPILPTEYQQVEYIETTGTQYINTEYKAVGNLKFEGMVYTNVQNQEMAIIGSSQVNGTIEIGFSQTNNRFFVWSSSSAGIIPNSSIYDTKLKFIAKLNLTAPYKELTLDIDSGLYSSSSEQNNNYIGENIQLFRLYTERRYTGRLYYLKIYDNETLVRDFIPCYRKSDNKIGLYDLVTKKLYTNQGSDNFLLGPEI